LYVYSSMDQFVVHAQQTNMEGGGVSGHDFQGDSDNNNIIITAHPEYNIYITIH